MHLLRIAFQSIGLSSRYDRKCKLSTFSGWKWFHAENHICNLIHLCIAVATNNRNCLGILLRTSPNAWLARSRRSVSHEDHMHKSKSWTFGSPEWSHVLDPFIVFYHMLCRQTARWWYLSRLRASLNSLVKNFSVFSDESLWCTVEGIVKSPQMLSKTEIGHLWEIWVDGERCNFCPIFRSQIIFLRGLSESLSERIAIFVQVFVRYVKITLSQRFLFLCVERYFSPAHFVRIAMIPSEICLRIEIGIPKTQGPSTVKFDDIQGVQ
jgi:hypothetical protein